MLRVVLPGTFVCAIGVDDCSLAVWNAIFYLSDVVTFLPDDSAESGHHPIQPWAFDDEATVCCDHSCDSMGLTFLVHLPNQPPVMTNLFVLDPLFD